MLEKITWIHDDFITLNEARKDGRGKSLLVEIVKFAILIILIEIFLAAILDGGAVLLFKPATEIEKNLLSMFSLAIIILVIIGIIKFGEKRNLRSIGFSKDRAVSSYIKGLICGFVMFGLVVSIGYLTGQYKFNGFGSSSIFIIILFFIGFIIQAMHEEVVLRGWMFVSISRKNSMYVAMFVSSIVFVLIHMANSGIDLLSLVNIFLVALVFCVMFLRYDNIWFCGAAHTMWNFAESCLFGFAVSGKTAYPTILPFSQKNFSILGGGSFGPESSLITTVVLILSLAFFVFYPNIKKSLK